MGGPAPPLTPELCCAWQGCACRLQDKDDAQDFTGLVKALQALGLCAEELTAVWAVLASILQLGNICFSSSEVSFRRGAGSAVWLVCIIRAAVTSECGRLPAGPLRCPGKWMDFHLINEKAETRVFCLHTNLVPLRHHPKTDAWR